MAYFAQLDENNIVINVITVSNNDLKRKAWWDPLGLLTGKKELEKVGVDFCQDLVNDKSSRWRQTCNKTREGVHIEGGTPFRKNYAGIGMIYDEDRDAFYVPRPVVDGVVYKSWIFNEFTCWFEPPIPCPNKFNVDIADDKFYRWDEDNLNWVEQEFSTKMEDNMNWSRKGRNPGGGLLNKDQLKDFGIVLHED